MSDVVLVEEIQILAEQVNASVLRDEVEAIEILAAAEQGPPGPSGPIGPAGGVAFTRQSDAPLSALRVVWEDESGVVRPLDAGNADHIDLICGLTLTAAAGPGDVTVQRSGPVDDAAWNWAPGRVFLGANGALTQTPPVGGFDVLVGVAVSATRLILNFQDPIELE